LFRIELGARDPYAASLARTGETFQRPIDRLGG
jgi:hypothetical protein